MHWCSLSHADVSNQDLQHWVDESALVFEGKILSLDSNVDGIDESDNPMTVKVKSIVLAMIRRCKISVRWLAKS